MVSDCDEAINRFGGEELMIQGASYEIAEVLLPQAPQNAWDEVITNTREFKLPVTANLPETHESDVQMDLSLALPPARKPLDI